MENYWALIRLWTRIGDDWGGSMMSRSEQPTGAAFFDLDKTILATSSTIALHRPFIDADLVTRRAAILSVLVHLPYLIKGADEERMNAMAESIGNLAKGINAPILESVVEDSLDTVIDPVCYLGALAEIERHRAAGRPIVVASASVIEMVRPIARRLGADEVLASIGQTDEHGDYTGRILHYNQAEGKASACAALAAERGWDLSASWAYSDSVSDIPLLSSVGHPVAVNPDRGLKRAALDNEWEIMRFSDTARVSRSLPVPSPRTLGIAAFSLGLIAAGVAFAVTRKR